MISRSDWEPLPTPILSPFARGYLSLCRFFTAAVWCVPALRVPLVHSLINHFIAKMNIFIPTSRIINVYPVPALELVLTLVCCDVALMGQITDLTTVGVWCCARRS